jgi:hypothetical protein
VVRPLDTFATPRAIETTTRVSTIPCDQVLGVWRGGVSATRDSMDVTDVSGVYEGELRARLMQRLLTPACTSTSACHQVWTGASGVYGTRMLGKTAL